MKTIPYEKLGRQTKCIMGDSKIASGKEVSAHPSHLFLIILLYGAKGFFWPRTDGSTGVKNTPYVRACIRKTALWLKGCISFACFLSFSSAKSAFSIWQSNQALVEAVSKCRLHGFKMETSNSVHYLTNLRSTLPFLWMQCNRRRSSLSFSMSYILYDYEFILLWSQDSDSKYYQLPINGLINELMNSSNYFINIQFIKYISACFDVRDKLLSK